MVEPTPFEKYATVKMGNLPPIFGVKIKNFETTQLLLLGRMAHCAGR